MLSESTVVAEEGLKAIPITDTDTPEKQMHGCIHQLRNAYVKRAAREFFHMLGQSTSVIFQINQKNP